jgi:diguanylate cyclase (GGDEF)-like protein
MTPVCIYILHVVIKLTMLYSGDYADFVTYHLMMTIVLMAFGIRFVLPLFTIVLVGAGVFSIIYGQYLQLPINYAKFYNYYGLYACVVVALVAISEWHERLAFLQGLLLDHHSAQLTLLNQELAHIAHEDALTGIANRRNFDETAAKEWDRGVRDKQPLTLLLLDVDFFKRFNDFYGHTAGDVCLRNIAQAIQSCILRTSDIVARYGGEEFVILLPNTETIGGIRIAQRMIEAVDALAIAHARSDAAPHVTISIGISTVIATPQLSLKYVLDAADKALYQAKKQGRHQYVFDQPEATDAPKLSALA